MDQRTLTNRIARNLDIDAKDVSMLGDAMADIFQDVLADCDTVAIPGFGTFSGVKTDEHEALAANGTKVLMPPSISVVFEPGSRLRKEAMQRL